VTSTPFRVSALPADHLDELRGRGVDDFGNPLVVSVVSREGETPLRCCLREAAVGERVALLAYRPAGKGGAYAEVGPVFVHADACPGYGETAGYPEGFRHRTQLLRAYDSQGRQVENVIVDGADAECRIRDLFARPDVAYLHSRNVLAGCYMFAVRRGEVSVP
jgi:Protein of unknown function (DUF1203)